VLLAVDGPVATITLNRPERKNALDGPAWGLLREHLARVDADPAVRAVILTGAGGEFCSGADVTAPRGNAHPLRRLGHIGATLIALHELTKPVVARVDGVAVGAGWNLALCCDLIVATPRSRFSQIFARRGLSLDCGGSWLLPRLVGLHTAKRLAYFAEIISAEEAMRLGLVTWLVGEDEVVAFTHRIARDLAAAPPVAIAQNKALLHRSHRMSFRDAIDAENAAQAINFATDGPVARAAIAAGNRPVFAGEWQL